MGAMRPADVERLLRVLTPALALLAACDSKAPDPAPPTAESNVPTPAAPGEDTKAGTEVAAAEASKPPNEEKPPQEAALADGDTAAAQTPPQPEAPPEEKPPESDPKPATVEPPGLDARPMPKRPLPKCPSGTTCLDKATAKAFAAKGPRALGCPTQIESKPGKKAPRGIRWSAKQTFDKAKTRSTRADGTKDACCYSWRTPCPGGRPLLGADGTPVVANMVPAVDRVAPSSARSFAAHSWLDDAAMEHASVASFGRVALELLSLGAPLDLVEDAHRAALDELQHARHCFALAEACGAPPVEPGPLAVLPPRSPDLRRFAVDTFIEGCVGESIAALAMTRAAAAAPAPDIRIPLERIAEDEARHAALAWRMVAWAVERGGASVAEAVRGAAAELREEMLTPANEDAPAGVSDFGRLDAAALTAVRRDGWHGLVEPMLARLGANAAVETAVGLS